MDRAAVFLRANQKKERTSLLSDALSFFGDLAFPFMPK